MVICKIAFRLIDDAEILEQAVRKAIFKMIGLGHGLPRDLVRLEERSCSINNPSSVEKLCRQAAGSGFDRPCDHDSVIILDIIGADTIENFFIFCVCEPVAEYGGEYLPCEKSSVLVVLLFNMG